MDAALAQRDALIESLRAENAELRRQLGQDSRSSSKPPSTDSPFAKPAPKSLRRRSGRRPGGRPGHPGATLGQVEKPDEVVVREPHACSGCGRDLAGCPVSGLTRRQVFDIPPVTVKVSEHRLIERECPCGVATRADAPAGVDGPVQYGPRIAAVIVYLICGAAPAQETHRPRVDRTVLHPGLARHGRRDHSPRCRRPGQLPGGWYARGSPARRWPTSTRPGCGSTPSCGGSIPPRPARNR
ncbi:MAG: DUF6444 domain-containing protein [Dermatophilaceae bacterium]